MQSGTYVITSGEHLDHASELRGLTEKDSSFTAGHSRRVAALAVLVLLRAPDESARGFLGNLLPELGQELELRLLFPLLHICPVLAGLQHLQPVLSVSHF